jgi:hypothetical protein
MDTADLVTLAQAKSLDQFVSALPNVFLVLSSDGSDSSSISFRTITAPMPVRPAEVVTQPRGFELEVVEVAKAPGNPYPDRISLGRARNCDVVIRDPSVSKLHAHFRVGERRTLDLIDYGSQNGTRVNGKALVPNDPVRVQPGDKIVFGRVAATLQDAARLYETLHVLQRMRSALKDVKR